MTLDAEARFRQASDLERTGSWSRAVAVLRQVYSDSVREGSVPDLMEAVVRLGHCYRKAGELELAGDLLELGAALGRVHGLPRITARAMNGLAMLEQFTGRLEVADELYRRAHTLGREADDAVVMGETLQNLGTLENIRGNHQAALHHYREGLAHLERAGSTASRIGVLNNLGMLSIDLGELEEAERYFAAALAVCSEVEDVVSAGVIHINRVELYLARGELDQARESCDEGFEIFSRLNQGPRKAEALKFYGIIYRESGKPHLAESHLRQAIELAAQTRDPLLEAQSQRELARVLRDQGRNGEALEAMNRAHALFAALQARPDLADIDDRLRDLEEEFLAVVRVWGESIEAKDHYTVGHCARVADYACRVAERAGLTPGEIVWFRMGAFLHDVGKTEVPEEVLNKPGKLTPEEFALMERHTIIGDEMLAPVAFPWDIRPMVRSHHERWDGTGYPDRLAGEEIPLSARILHVADVFDALTTARSYRRRLTPEEALAIMEDDAGSFDPRVFAIFRGLFPELAPTARTALSSAG